MSAKIACKKKKKKNGKDVLSLGETQEVQGEEVEIVREGKEMVGNKIELPQKTWHNNLMSKGSTSQDTKSC